MIYFIQEDKDGPIKIGHARDVKKRLASIQTNTSHELHLLATMQGSNVVEADLHMRFAEWRIRGEWFKPGPPILAFVASINSADGPRRIVGNESDDVIVCRMCGWAVSHKRAEDRAQHAQVHARLARTALLFPLDEMLKSWGYSIIQTGNPGDFFRTQYSKETGKRIMSFARWLTVRSHPTATPQEFVQFMAEQLDELDRLYPEDDGM